MALTSRIGTIDSRYSNVTYGQTVVTSSSYDVSLTLPATAGFTPSVQAVDNPSITLNPTAGFTSSGGSDLQASRTEAATAGFTPSVQADLEPAITLNPTAGFTPSVQADLEPAITLTETASFTGSGGSDLQASDTESATAGFSVTGQPIYNPSQAMSATAGMTIDPGLVSNPAEALAVITDFIVGVTATFVRPSSNTVTFSQTLAYALVKEAIASNFLNLHQHVSIPGNEAFNDSLDFSQSATYSRIINQSVSHTFAPTQTIVANKTINFTITHSLVFQETYYRVTPIPGLIIPVPQAMATVVNKRKCNVILQAPFGVIVLPCPQLGDKLSNSGLELKIKYSTNGQAYTYIRKTDLQKLSYTFWLERKKSLELRAFLIEYNQSNDPLTLTNWKGEVWVTSIVNSPVALTGKTRWAPCGEQVSVTIEFEGIKVMG